MMFTVTMLDMSLRYCYILLIVLGIHIILLTYMYVNEQNVFNLKKIHLVNRHNLYPFHKAEKQYTVPSSVDQRVMQGKRFSTEVYQHSLIEKLDGTMVEKLNLATLQNYPIVTGSEETHFDENLSELWSIEQAGINRTVYFYDLGLNATQLEEIKRAPSYVIYRKFDYDSYPEHVKHLHGYAFKGNKRKPCC